MRTLAKVARKVIFLTDIIYSLQEFTRSSCIRKKIKSLGVDVYSGRMTHFTGLKSANVLSNDGSTSYVHFDKFVNATGAVLH